MIASMFRLGDAFTGGARLSILIYHQVLATFDPMRADEPTATEFEETALWIKRHFDVLRLSDAITRLRDGRLSAPTLAITFDDGYGDNFRVALPILRKHGLPATFFIATGYLDGGAMFNDTVTEAFRQAPAGAYHIPELGPSEVRIADWTSRREVAAETVRAIKYLAPAQREARAAAIASMLGSTKQPDLMMTSHEVLALCDAGMELGAHTHTHPILCSTDIESAAADIARGRERLQSIINKPVELFAYPNGVPGRDYSREHVEIVRRQGFSAAVSTAVGSARRRVDPFQIPRYTPWSRQRVRFGLDLARVRWSRGYGRV